MNPIDVKISTITVSCRLPNCDMNLTNIGKYLDIDETIIGIKYKYADLNLTKGTYSTTIYKKSKVKDEQKINKSLFYNQVTIIVNNNGNHVNVKLFGNGSLHLTGCKAIHEACDVAKILYAKLDAMRHKTDIIFLTKDVNNVLLDKDKLVYSYTKNQIIGFVKDYNYMVNKKEYTVDSTTDTLVSKKMETGRKRTIINFDGEEIGNVKIELLKNKTKFYKKNTNIYYDTKNGLIYYNDLILGKIVYDIDESKCTNTHAYPDACEVIYRCNPFIDEDYILDITRNDLNQVLDVDINCINVYFNIGFKINRSRLYEILIENRFICKYKPESYSGIKLIYKIPMDYSCELDGNGNVNGNVNVGIGLCRCNAKCTCKNITFLIFQSGNVIATGFKTYEQISQITKRFMDTIMSVHHIVSTKIG